MCLALAHPPSIDQVKIEDAFLRGKRDKRPDSGSAQAPPRLGGGADRKEKDEDEEVRFGVYRREHYKLSLDICEFVSRELVSASEC